MADRSRNEFGMTSGVRDEDKIRGDTENVSFWAIWEGALRGCPPLEGVAEDCEAGWRQGETSPSFMNMYFIRGVK